MLEILTAYAICDNCRTKIFVGTGEDWLKYHREWFVGVVDLYCPACQKLPEIKTLVDEEIQITGSFRIEPEEAEIDFPEYIS